MSPFNMSTKGVLVAAVLMTTACADVTEPLDPTTAPVEGVYDQKAKAVAPTASPGISDNTIVYMSDVYVFEGDHVWKRLFVGTRTVDGRSSNFMGSDMGTYTRNGTGLTLQHSEGNAELATFTGYGMVVVGTDYVITYLRR